MVIASSVALTASLIDGSIRVGSMRVSMERTLATGFGKILSPRGAPQTHIFSVKRSSAEPHRSIRTYVQTSPDQGPGFLIGQRTTRNAALKYYASPALDLELR